MSIPMKCSTNYEDKCDGYPAGWISCGIFLSHGYIYHEIFEKILSSKLQCGALEAVHLNQCRILKESPTCRGEEAIFLRPYMTPWRRCHFFRRDDAIKEEMQFLPILRPHAYLIDFFLVICRFALYL